MMDKIIGMEICQYWWFFNKSDIIEANPENMDCMPKENPCLMRECILHN
jgi:hypothetical protein